jgi:hypothetical protein
VRGKRERPGAASAGGEARRRARMRRRDARVTLRRRARARDRRAGAHLPFFLLEPLQLRVEHPLRRTARVAGASQPCALPCGSQRHGHGQRRQRSAAGNAPLILSDLLRQRASLLRRHQPRRRGRLAEAHGGGTLGAAREKKPRREATGGDRRREGGSCLRSVPRARFGRRVTTARQCGLAHEHERTSAACPLDQAARAAVSAACKADR